MKTLRAGEHLLDTEAGVYVEKGRHIGEVGVTLNLGVAEVTFTTARLVD